MFGRLLLVRVFPMILSSLLVAGCENFTLIGSVNLGEGSPLADIEPDQQAGQEDGAVHEPVGDGVCWPSGQAAVDEMIAHGFTPKKWPAVEAWFSQLKKVKAALPECP